MKIIVTGGAGFIGSCMVRALNDAGYTDIVVVDNICSTEKWKNLVNKNYSEYISRNEFLERLPEFSGQVSHVMQQPRRTLIFCTRIILNIQRRFGNSVQMRRSALFTQVVLQPTVPVSADSAMRMILEIFGL